MTLETSTQGLFTFEAPEWCLVKKLHLWFDPEDLITSDDPIDCAWLDLGGSE